MPLDLETVIKQLTDSSILAPATLENFIPPKASPNSVEELVSELVKSGNLTRFQAQNVAAGKTKALILGGYTVLDKIGAGGMGQVFKAEHRRMKRVVAIKMLPAAVNKHPAAVARFQREVEAAAKLSHPNIVAAYDADEANGQHFLVMEYVEGSDLLQLLRKNGPLPVAQAVNYILQAAKGLEFAHRKGVIHRDIKPANLLVDCEGTIKILDMGLARIDDQADQPVDDDTDQAVDGLTQANSLMGTIDYMAPEQAVNTHMADARSDIYSLGCTLYCFLAARNPYAGTTAAEKVLAHRQSPIPSLRALRADVPEMLERVYVRMMAKRPEERYTSVNELLADLEKCSLLPATSSSVALPPLAVTVLPPPLTAPPVAALPARAEPTVQQGSYSRFFANPNVLLGGSLALILLGALTYFMFFRAKAHDGISLVENDQQGTQAPIVASTPAPGPPLPESEALQKATSLPAPNVLSPGTLAEVKPVTISAAAENGYSLGAVPRGSILAVQYVGGKWKSWGHIPTENPDAAQPAGGDGCRLAVVELGSGKGQTRTLAIVPAGTATKPFIWRADRDYPHLALRINDTGGEWNNPGNVQYKVRLDKPANRDALAAEERQSEAINPQPLANSGGSGHSPRNVPEIPFNPALERRAAEWVLSVGGKMRISANGQNAVAVSQVGQLPAGQLRVNGVDLSSLRQVDDAALAHLDGLSHLLSLNLMGTGITSDAGQHIRLHAWLDGLEVSRTSFGDAGIEQLAALNRLASFSGGGTPITDRGAKLLSSIKSLRTVTLYTTRITDAAIGYLSQLPLERLSIEVTRVTDAAMQDLRKCKTLRYLNIRETAISDAGLAVAAHLPLETLFLRDTRITDRSIETLAGMKSLTELSLSNPPISQAAYQKLKESLPACDIQWSPSTLPVAAARSQPTPGSAAKRLASGRFPVPDSTARQTALQLLKEIFKDDYAAASKPEDKLALAKKLVQQAEKSTDDAAGRYTMLSEALRLAIDAGDMKMLQRAVTALAKDYEVGEDDMLVESWSELLHKTRSTAVMKATSEAAVAKFEQAVADEDFDLATRLSKLALEAARKSKEGDLVKQATGREKSLATQKHEWEALQKTIAVLQENPDDPAANLAMGRHLSFVQGNWEQGLEALAKGSDPILKGLAEKTLVFPSQPEAQVELGDAWFSAAEAAKGKSKADFQKGARYCYDRALPSISGLVKTKVEKRLKELTDDATAASSRKPRKALILKNAANGLDLPGPLDCASQAYQVQIGPTFDIQKSWRFALEFALPDLGEGDHNILFWGDDRGSRDPIYLRQDGARLDVVVGDTAKEQSQAISVPITEAAVGRWVFLVFQFDAAANEFSLFLDGQLVKREAATIRPSVDRPMPIWIGGLNEKDSRFAGMVRNLRLGNVGRSTTRVEKAAR